MNNFFEKLGKAITFNKEDEKEQQIIFFHNENSLIKFEIPDKENLQRSIHILDYNISPKNEKKQLDYEDLEKIKIDQILSSLKPKIDKYLLYEDIDFNCDFMRNLYSYAEEIGFEHTIAYLLVLVQELTYKKDMSILIISAFLENFAKFFNFIYRFDTDHSLILNKLLPVITDILKFQKDIPLLNKARNSLKIIIENLKPNECDTKIVPFLIELSNNEKNVIGQKEAIKIFNENVKYLRKEVVECFVLPQYQSFSDNYDPTVRYCCINNMINIFQVVDYETIKEKLIPIYLKLSIDKYNMIRKICCDIIPNICKISKKKLISKEILPIYLKLINDPENDIKTSALTVFGEFISYLEKVDIVKHKELLIFYKTHILQLLEENKYTDMQNLYKCAFSFPSVILIYYKKVDEKNWEILEEIYEKLIESKDSRIKTTLANSFGEVSSILDKNITENVIGPLISNMYKENGTNIKNIIIKIIPDYLVNVSDEKIKMDFLTIFKKGYINIKITKTWREKIVYINGIKKLAKLYDINTLFKVLVNLCCQFCFDSFEVVRIRASKIFSYLALIILTNEEEQKYKDNILSIIKMFATCRNYKYRQLFFHTCYYLFEDEKIFMENILSDFKNASYDKVSNVRITLSKFLNKKWKSKKEKEKWIRTNETLINIIYRLKNDKDKEVKDSLNKVDINEINKDVINEDKNSELNDVNHAFTCRFEEMKNIFNFIPQV